ncbi:hypothetical protein GEZ98_06465 [Streptococcus mitis]|uniref:Uncharacterized protein n=1 Tax=Streptococcus mitis TaxID=28037 RepID=A0A7X1QZ93_STRMT|nr:hypothetical protein [Streptococcus mitis]MQQ02534.1 hypothetical protein [Streptococcus mitis]
MNRHKKWSIITLVICIIGGIVMFSLNQQKEKTLEEKMRIEQDRMALYLVNHYEGINEIEFNDVENNATTGSRTALLTLNKELEMEITFFKFNDKTDNYVISWNKRLNLQEKNEITNQQTIDNIKVKYWSK